MRSVGSAFVATLLIGAISVPAFGSNWGADPPPDEGVRCLVNDRDSECTDNSGLIWVYVSVYVYDPLEMAVETSLDTDYDPVVGIFATRVSDPGDADVFVFDDNTIGPTSWYGYETCIPGTVHLHEVPIHSWCEHRVIYNNYHNGYFDTSNGRKHAACHEIGHVLGLRHATGSDHPGSYQESCMRNFTSSSTLDPSNADINHLQDFYPHPPE